MIAKDEERMLLGALVSVKRIADEIVVGVDSKSTDQTEAIARGAGARVHHFDWRDDFSYARNVGLRKAKRDWIFVIDPDERLTDYGAAMILLTMRSPRSDVDGYAFMSDQRTLGNYRAKQDGSLSVRLFRNTPAIQYVNRVHEQIRKNGKPIPIGTFTKEAGLVHYGYDVPLYRERGKHERNLTLLLRELQERPDDRSVPYNLARQFNAVGDKEQARIWARVALGMTGEIAPGGEAMLERLAS